MNFKLGDFVYRKPIRHGHTWLKHEMVLRTARDDGRLQVTYVSDDGKMIGINNVVNDELHGSAAQGTPMKFESVNFILEGHAFSISSDEPVAETPAIEPPKLHGFNWARKRIKRGLRVRRDHWPEGFFLEEATIDMESDIDNKTSKMYLVVAGDGGRSREDSPYTFSANDIFAKNWHKA